MANGKFRGGTPKQMQKPKQAQNSYFEKEIKKKGEGFLNFKTATDLQRDSIKIIRELARGNIDLDKYGELFYNQALISNMLIAVQAKYQIESIHRNGTGILYSQQVQSMNPEAQTTAMVLQNDIQRCNAYEIAISYLNNFICSGDLQQIYTMANQLNPFRYII